MRKKILIILDSPKAPQFLGGVEYHVCDIVREIDRSTFEVSCASDNSDYISWLTAITNDLPIVTYQLHASSRSLYGELRFIASIFRLIRKTRPDVIHAHKFRGSAYAALVSIFFGTVKVVSTLHWFPSFSSDSFKRRHTVKPAYVACAHLLIDQNIVQSAPALAYLRTRLLIPMKKIKLLRNSIHNGALYAHMHPAMHSHSIICVARLSKEKRIGDLIRAFARVIAILPSASLLIVGDGPEALQLHGLARSLGVETRITFTGEISREDVPAHLSKSAIFCLTSQLESMPYAIMEAMTLGLPVVATRVGGIPDMVDDGKGGILTTLGDIDSLATALVSLLRNPKCARDMGQYNKEVAKKLFDSRTNMTILETIYRNL